MNYTYPQVDDSTNETTLGNFKISFSDGSSITVSDDDSSKWYLLEGVDPYVRKQLI